MGFTFYNRVTYSEPRDSDSGMVTTSRYYIMAHNLLNRLGSSIGQCLILEDKGEALYYIHALLV